MKWWSFDLCIRPESLVRLQRNSCVKSTWSHSWFVRPLCSGCYRKRLQWADINDAHRYGNRANKQHLKNLLVIVNPDIGLRINLCTCFAIFPTDCHLLLLTRRTRQRLSYKTITDHSDSCSCCLEYSSNSWHIAVIDSEFFHPTCHISSFFFQLPNDPTLAKILTTADQYLTWWIFV